MLLQIYRLHHFMESSVSTRRYDDIEAMPLSTNQLRRMSRRFGRNHFRGGPRVGERTLDLLQRASGLPTTRRRIDDHQVSVLTHSSSFSSSTMRQNKSVPPTAFSGRTKS